MYELRWLEKETGKKLQNEWGYYYDETVQVLQYRVKYDSNIYAGMGPWPDNIRQMVWSDWKDVPVVIENESKGTV